MRKGTKPELLTMVDIARGVVAGRLADQFQGRSEAAYESALRGPLLATAQKRGFVVALEERMPAPARKRGARLKIDGVLKYGDQVIAIEFKTVRPKAPALDLKHDCAKLRDFIRRVPKGTRGSAWLLIGWDELALKGKPSANLTKRVQNVVQVGTGRRATLLRDVDVDLRRRRTASANEAFLIDGCVGRFRAWCLVVCVVNS